MVNDIGTNATGEGRDRRLTAPATNGTSDEPFFTGATERTGMAIALADLLWTALFVLFYLLVAVVAIAAAVGIPAFAGKTVYDRANTEGLSNPAVLGLGAAFFSILIGLFAAGLLLTYFG